MSDKIKAMNIPKGMRWVLEALCFLNGTKLEEATKEQIGGFLADRYRSMKTKGMGRKKYIAACRWAGVQPVPEPVKEKRVGRCADTPEGFYYEMQKENKP